MHKTLYTRRGLRAGPLLQLPSLSLHRFLCPLCLSVPCDKVWDRNPYHLRRLYGQIHSCWWENWTKNFKESRMMIFYKTKHSDWLSLLWDFQRRPELLQKGKISLIEEMSLQGAGNLFFFPAVYHGWVNLSEDFAILTKFWEGEPKESWESRGAISFRSPWRFPSVWLPFLQEAAFPQKNVTFSVARPTFTGSCRSASSSICVKNA